MPNIPAYILYPLAIIISAIISAYAVKKIIFITQTRKIYDIPDNIRKIHGAQIPSLGGIGIFTGYVITAMFFITDAKWYYVIAASVILFFTGIYDDIMNMRPSKKFVAQVVASAIGVLLADIRIEQLYGLLGIYELPYVASVALTIFCCTFFINVFNFMDGIDGLACTLAILYLTVLGLLFAFFHFNGYAGVSFCLVGATIGLLFFNRPPARIYMGDTGSMFLGFTIFMLGISWLKIPMRCGPLSQDMIITTLMVLVSLFFLPVYDAVRVFILRVSKGISPLHADRLHLHYYLLDAGLTHTGAVIVITATNVATMACAWLLRGMHAMVQLGSMALITTVAILWAARRRKQLK